MYMTANFKSLLVSGLLFLAACRSGKTNEDPDLLNDVLASYFKGIEQKDTAKLKSLVTDDFILFEDGDIWNNDSAFKNIRRHLPFTVKYRLAEIRTHVDGNSGDMVYTNHADFVFRDSTKRSIDWLESATFRKTAEGWKINFLHLTERTPRYDTIRYFREHYNARVKIFSSEPVKKGGVVFLGNSITEYGDWKRLTGDSTAINRGIAADNSFGVLDRLDEVIARQPRKLIIEIGINDIGQDIPVPVITENIFSIVAKIRAGSPVTTVYVVSVLPAGDNVRPEYPELYGKNGIVDLLDDNLRRNASAKNFVYVDLKCHLSNASGDLDRRYARPDGLHLNEAGYRVWIKSFPGLRSKPDPFLY